MTTTEQRRPLLTRGRLTVEFHVSGAEPVDTARGLISPERVEIEISATGAAKVVVHGLLLRSSRLRDWWSADWYQDGQGQDFAPHLPRLEDAPGWVRDAVAEISK